MVAQFKKRKDGIEPLSFDWSLESEEHDEQTRLADWIMIHLSSSLLTNTK